MTLSGHFAGPIVRMKLPNVDDDERKLDKEWQTETTQAGDGGSEAQDVTSTFRPFFDIHCEVIPFGTLHKQGGAQGLSDNAKSKAISIGAMLRRHGEQALRDVSMPSRIHVRYVYNTVRRGFKTRQRRLAIVTAYGLPIDASSSITKLLSLRKVPYIIAFVCFAHDRCRRR